MKLIKSISKLLVTILTITLVITLFSNVTFAKEDDPYVKYRQGSGYVALGDSFTRGFGEGENFETRNGKMDSLKDKNCRNVKGSFSYQLAQALGLSTPDDITDKSAQYWPIAQNAISCTFINDLLGIDDGIVDEYVYGKTCKGRYNVDLTYFGDEESYDIGGIQRYGKEGSAMSIRDMVDNATVITIELGMGDVFERAYELYLYDQQFENLQQVVQAVNNFVVESYRAIDRFKTAYDALLSYIKQANGDAAVIILGTANTMEDVVVWKGSSISIGNLLSPVFDLLNDYYRQMADKYDFIFVDIANVESHISENGYSIVQSFKNNRHIVTHPTANGYTQIARMILNALNEKDLNEYHIDTKIRVDLGRFDSVDKVRVNGVETTDYTFNDHYLVVNYDSKCATVLTVEQKVNSDDRVACYYLSYNDGYIVNRLYVSNHFLKQEKGFLSNLPIVDFDAFERAADNQEKNKEVEIVDLQQPESEEIVEIEQEQPIEQQQPIVVEQENNDVVEQENNDVVEQENNDVVEQEVNLQQDNQINQSWQKVEQFLTEEIIEPVKEVNKKIKSLFKK